MIAKFAVPSSSFAPLALRSEEQVERLVRENEKLVQYQVNRYLQRYSVRGMEREDLISWGLMGLVQAARAWDPGRGAFSTVACTAIEWMLHRGVRREWNVEAAAVTVSLDELISAEETGDSSERFMDQLADEPHVENDLLADQTRAALRSAVDRLPPLERRLIERHFYEDVPIARVAAEMGVSRQRIGERQRRALRQLRQALAASAVPTCL
jgi:RNA polymerase sigma factor (sigma-70 family)